MRGFYFRFICALVLGAFFSGCSCSKPVFFQDISPNAPNGQIQFEASTAGLTYALAGDETALYAVSLNAGIFKSANGGSWSQLANSPRYTTSLAVDPFNPSHLVAGERNGDATPIVLNRTGVWESNDAGSTWTFTFNPAKQAGCRAAGTQAVPAVFFSPTTGTLFIGTPCGLGRRPVGKTDFDFTPSPTAAGAVKAFEVSRTAGGVTMLWARADNASDGRTRILWSTNDGANWKVVLVPTSQDGFGIGSPTRGGDFAIAAYGQTAVLDFRPDATSDPNKWDPKNSNFCTLLYYFQDIDLFKVQTLNNGDGTGLGGRKRLRTFVSNNARENGVSVTGQNLQIFFIAAQDVLQATGLNQDQTLAWNRIVLARCSGCNTSDNVHSDIWDVHYAASSGVIRLATDGGVYYRQGGNWASQNDGLHTHHVHSLSVLPTSAYPRLAYVVTDNSEWFRDKKPLAPPFNDWSTYSRLGDGSWSAADPIGPPVALLVRHSTDAIFTDFGLGMPPGSGIGANTQFTPLCGPDGSGTKCRDFTTLGPGTFAVIQTPLYRNSAPLLDVVMLVPTPLFSLQNGKVVPVNGGPLAGVTSATGGPLLIRNRQYLAHPDVSQSQFQDWELVANDVPAGAQAIWVANGHVNPVYYVYTMDGAGTVSVFRRNPGQGGWFQLQGIGAPVLNPGTVYGPLYVNPYDADHIFVLAADGIRIPTLTRGSEIGAFTPFEVDTVLTALLTNSGEYPMSLAFNGGNGGNVVNFSQAVVFPKAVLAQMAFNPYDTQAVVAASPVTGLYYQAKKYGGWRTLTPFLPTPYTMTSTVGMDSQTIYVGTEGRGVWRFLVYDNAKLGCYYDQSQSTGPDEIARLTSASTLPIGGVNVSVIVVRDGIETTTSVKTGLLGQIIVPNAAGSIVNLSYPGDDNIGPCETSLSR